MTQNYIRELEWYQSHATDAQKSAYYVLNKLGWPERLTSKDFAGMPGATGIGRWIQRSGYELVRNRKWADGAWRDEGSSKPYNVYQKLPAVR